MKEYTPQIGDVVIVWGKAITSKIVQFLIRTLFGEKDPPSHVQVVFSDNTDISAESSGVDFVDREKTIRGAKKILIARNRRMTAEKQVVLGNIIPSYLGKPYDFFIYILWFLRIAFVLNPVVFMILYPYRDWLKQGEKRSYTCSELTSTLLSSIGLGFGIEQHRNASPHDCLQIIQACSDWGIVQEFNS